MADSKRVRSDSSSDESDVNSPVNPSKQVATPTQGPGRPRKTWEALSYRSKCRRKKECEEWLLESDRTAPFSGQSDNVDFLESLSKDQNLGELFGECSSTRVDECSSTRVDECSSMRVDECSSTRVDGLLQVDCPSTSPLPDEKGDVISEEFDDVLNVDHQGTRTSVADDFDFQWEEDVNFSVGAFLEGIGDEAAPFLNLNYEELMNLEEPMSEEEDEGLLFDYSAALGSNESSVNILEGKLAVWRSKHNISRTAMTDLLHILVEHRPVEDFSKLPLDSRTVTRHTSVINVEGFQTISNCAGGTYIHLSLEDQTNRILSEVDDDVLDSVEEIVYDVSTDGFNLWNSSSSHIWPWMGRIVSIPAVKDIVFLIGAWFGERSKPTCGNIFSAKLVEELSLMLQNGIILKSKHRTIGVRCIIADAPAKSLILEIVYFNGYSSCTKCNVFGSWDGRTFFPLWQCETAVKRTHDGYQTAIDSKHHLDAPILATLPGFDVPKMVPLDPMHLLYRGIQKCLLGLWTSGERPYRLSIKLCNSISSNLVKCRNYVPSDFQRKPRSLTDLPFFKATEYRLFALYIGPACVKKELDTPRYVNFLCFHVAIRILADPKLCVQEKFLLYAEKLLKKFLQQFCQLYDEKFLTHNFHGVYPGHLVDDVRRLGPLESFSSFPYDNFLRHLREKIRKGDHVLQQLVNRYIEDAVLAIKQTSSVLSSPQFEGSHEMGPLLSICSGPQYRSVHFKNFKISVTAEAESFCFTKQNEVVSVENICWCKKLKCMVVLGRKFLQVEDFFDVPCQSSLINIFRVSKSKLSPLNVWAVSDVVYKMLAVPYDLDFVMYPLLHCEI